MPGALTAASENSRSATRPRIAHFSGPNATIQNTPPLVTSNKARTKYGLPPLLNVDGSTPRFDVLRPQRLAAPATIYIEQFTAHPLERDTADLYGPPDGYLDQDGHFHTEKHSDGDKPVYEVTLTPDDGLYPLPYMARQADGSAWDDDCAYPGAPQAQARQPYYPDGARLFEEIDRLGVSEKGVGNLISSQVDVDFYRVAPSGGYTKGVAADLRTDEGAGWVSPEMPGRDFYGYRPYHLSQSPPRPVLAQVANQVQEALAAGRYSGAIWTQGSPRIEEMVYWLNLLIDTTLPICGNASHRLHGQISNDGDKNIVDSIDYISSGAWSDEAGRDRVGVVLIQDQQVFAAREVQKADARPGGFIATGGHGGIVGAAGWEGPPLVTYIPTRRHTYTSEVNRPRLPSEVDGVLKSGIVRVRIKDREGRLIGDAIPKVTIVKDGNYTVDESNGDVSREVDVLAQIDRNLASYPLAGFVVEGLAPYGRLTSAERTKVMKRALFSGMPVALVGRGNPAGFVTHPSPPFIAGGNLTATKARILMTAAILKIGALPPAQDPDRPSSDERTAVAEKIAAYQAVFDEH